MATRQWAVNADGTFDFNNPANWVFATVPGAVDVAQFNTNATDTVTGDATVAELLVTQGTIDLAGSYTMSGAQATELSVASASLTIDAGASISGTGNISVNNSLFFVNGTLAGGSATIANSDVNLSTGSVFDVGPITFSGSNDLGVSPLFGFALDLQINNAIQVSGSIAAIGTQLTIVGTISGTGSLIVLDGSVELDGNNTYSGGTTLGAGVLAVGNANALGTGALTIRGGELLATTTESIANQLTMSGNFTIAAAHGQTLTISPAHPWTLNTDPITSRLVSFGTPGQDGTILWATPAGSQVNGGGVFAVAVQAGTLRAADGSFGLLFAYAGRTTVQTGATLDVGGFSTSVTDLEGGGHITDSGAATTLAVTGGSFGGVIDGALALNVSGGSLTLSGNNAYTGATTITGGATLTLGTGGATGSVPGAIADNGILAINRSDSFVVNNVSGTGQLQQIGSGVTTLGTGLSYTGGTQIMAGTLAVGNAAALGAGGLTISGGELLATATESISNQLTMSGNFTIAAAHNQTLTFSPALSWFFSASNNVVTFGAPGQDGTIVWATPAGSAFNFPAGASYTVLVQAGTLRAADSSFGLLLQSDQRTAIRPAATIDVAGFSTYINNLQGGGHITDSGAAASLSVIGGNFSGVIAGPLALHTVSTALTLSGNNTYTGGTTIAGGTTLTLGAGGTTGSVPGAIFDLGVLAINRSDSFVVNNVSGNGQLQQIGPGVTSLGTGLSYTGGTLIAAGTLVVSDPSALGTGGLTLSGELLATTTESIGNQLTMSGNFTIAAAHNQTLTFSSASPWSLTTTTGEVITFGAPGQDGAVVWATPNGSSITNGALYTILVQAGTLRAADSSFGFLLQSDQRTAIRPAGTIDAAGFSFAVNDLEGGGHITDSGAAATLTVIGGNFGGVIGGPLALVEALGALVLFGNNTYTGGTTINGGATLTLGGGGTAGSVAGNITDNGSLEFRRSDTFIEAGVISGTGNLVEDGPGTTVLTAANTYSGGTFLAGGTLELQAPGAIGSGAVRFLAGAPEVLRIDGTSMPTNGIFNFAAGDTIDLANIAANAWSYSGGVLSLTNDGAPVAQLNLSTPFANPLFGLSGDGGSGTDIVLEPPPPQDLNADSRADLVFQTPNNQFLGALSTGGGFTTPQPWVQYGGTFVAGEAQYADVNGDHRADLIMQGNNNSFYVSLSTGSGFTAPVQWLQLGGSFVPGQAQYADVNGDGRADLLFQGNDNKEYLSLSTGSSFGAPTLVADFGAYGSFQPGTLHA